MWAVHISVLFLIIVFYECKKFNWKRNIIIITTISCHGTMLTKEHACMCISFSSKSKLWKLYIYIYICKHMQWCSGHIQIYIYFYIFSHEWIWNSPPCEKNIRIDVNPSVPSMHFVKKHIYVDFAILSILSLDLSCHYN